MCEESGEVANTRPHSGPASDLWEQLHRPSPQGSQNYRAEQEKEGLGGSGNVQYGALLCVPTP